jgi:hypothetical protein
MEFPMSETNPIPGAYHEMVTYQIVKDVDWTEPGLKIVRLRFLSDHGLPYWDVSYCHGQLPNGDYVNVHLPFSQLLKFNNPINRQIRRFAARDQVSIKELNILNVISTFN